MPQELPRDDGVVRERDWPVWLVQDREDFIARMKVGVVPLTLVLSTGKVSAVFRGAFQEAQLQALLRHLDGGVG